MTLLSTLQSGTAQLNTLQSGGGGSLSWELIIVIAIIGVVAVAVAWLMGSGGSD